MERELRPGQADLIAFVLLQTRCKEIFFEYLLKDAKGETKKSASKFLVGLCGIYKSGLSQSPIEEIMEFALKLISYENENLCVPLLIFENQKKIELEDSFYIADFYFDTSLLTMTCLKPKKQLKLIIECDGHEFHEKTKEQVEHDNLRDYKLRIAGYDVLHFSGSQINKDPLKCAEDIWNYIVTKVEGWTYGREEDVCKEDC